MDRKAYYNYVMGLKATDVLTRMINRELKLCGIDQKISNCWLDSNGKYARFVFQIDDMPCNQSVMRLLANKYREKEPK